MYLMWEVSTPCVYARWFLANLGQHNTRLYVANGLAMLGTFFVARNLLGLCAYNALSDAASSSESLAVSLWLCGHDGTQLPLPSTYASAQSKLTGCSL